MVEGGQKFYKPEQQWYGIVNLREPYIYLMALIYRLYGDKDFSKFSEAWIPLEYIVAIFQR
jgi:hypothetical protein